MRAAAPILEPYFFRDLAEGLQQYMFFLGQDIIHPKGNFLIKQGFQRTPTPSSNGTSCYRLPWQGGHIELHGACAGWYGIEQGFTFIRPRKRCNIWTAPQTPPVPGKWKTEHLDRSTPRDKLYASSLPFLDWLIAHDHEVIEQLGSNHRKRNHLLYQKVPQAKAWIEPELAMQWFKLYRHHPEKLVRPKKMSQKPHNLSLT